MPVILAIIGILGAAAFWIYRARGAANAASDILDAANDVRLAARRFGYKRKMNVHPADAVDDARIAATGIVLAFVELEKRTVRQENLDALIVQAQSVFDVNKDEAEGLVSVGAWINDQTGNSSEVVRRLQRRLHVLSGSAANKDLNAMIEQVAGPLGSEAQTTHESMMRVLNS